MAKWYARLKSAPRGEASMTALPCRQHIVVRPALDQMAQLVQPRLPRDRPLITAEEARSTGTRAFWSHCRHVDRVQEGQALVAVANAAA